MSDIGRAAEAVARADALLVGAGAGVGVDSGLPDFRGNQGFWRAYPPFRERGLSFIDMANPGWFDSDPRLAWGFYGHRLHLYRDTRPHAGFEILRAWGERGRHGCFVFTSNVDGQFQRAGFDGDRVVECHGSIHHLQCAGPCSRSIWTAEGTDIHVDASTFLADPPLPACADCGDVARPNILMFGDGRWLGWRTGQQEDRFDQWLDTIAGSELVVVEIGAGSAVPTVRWTCERSAQRLAATLIRINPREPDGPPGTLSFAAGALATLEEIDHALRGC